MKTDITTGISGAAGTPLAHQTIQSGRDAQKQVSSHLKSNDAISDTLETTDREADGRRTLVIKTENSDPHTDELQPEETGGLDLMG